ncbi:MAG: serine hydrolase domain-containing protein [Pseudomonadota bacterium]
MEKATIAASLIAAAFGLGMFGSANADQATTQPEIPQSALQELVSTRLAAANFSGVVLVADNDKIILEQAHYSPSLTEGDVIEPNSRFAIASMTKSFTTILVLELAEQGLLSLDDTLKAHLADYPADYAERITIRQLLQNRSGIPHYVDLPGWFDTEYKQSLSLEGLVSAIASLPLKFEPGSDYLYSSANCFLLGLIIEAVTGKSYEAVLSETILTPLELNDTGQIYAEAIEPAVVQNFLQEEDNAYVHIPIINPKLHRATASMYSTASDLFRWHQALWDDTLLSSDSQAEMFDRSGPMGWDVLAAPLENGETLPIQTYNGEMAGYTSMITRFPDRRGVVIILNNNNSGYNTLAILTLDIAAKLYGQ